MLGLLSPATAASREAYSDWVSFDSDCGDTRLLGWGLCGIGDGSGTATTFGETVWWVFDTDGAEVHGLRQDASAASSVNGFVLDRLTAILAAKEFAPECSPFGRHAHFRELISGERDVNYGGTVGPRSDGP